VRALTGPTTLKLIKLNSLVPVGMGEHTRDLSNLNISICMPLFKNRGTGIKSFFVGGGFVFCGDRYFFEGGLGVGVLFT
jgi:hypothetical protein